MIPFKGLTAYNVSHSPFGRSDKDAPMVFVHTRIHINIVTKRMLLIYEHQLPLPLEFMFVCSFQSFS